MTFSREDWRRVEGVPAWKIIHGDCLDAMRTMEPASVDAIVTDPPYGLGDHSLQKLEACLRAWLAGEAFNPNGGGFMGKSWDAWVPGPEVWRETLRVLKPGGHALVFAGTRSMDLMGLALRLAGFETRDAIGNAHGGESHEAPLLAWVYGSGFPKSHNGKWGATALKPSWEPIIMARKPLEGTVAANYEAHGTGGLNVDGCRIQFANKDDMAAAAAAAQRASQDQNTGRTAYGRFENGPASLQPYLDGMSRGRWPANLVLDETAAAMLDAQSGDTGGASRFFYCAKASRGEREAGIAQPVGLVAPKATAGTWANVELARNHHPTIKPLSLMRWLCRLVTPPGGLVLDPFTGSGTTGCAALREKFRFIGCEREAEFVEIARARLEHTTRKILKSVEQTDLLDLIAESEPAGDGEEVETEEHEDATV